MLCVSVQFTEHFSFLQINPVYPFLPFSFPVHLIMRRQIYGFYKHTSGNLTGSGRRCIFRIAGDRQIFHSMPFCQCKKQQTCFGSIPMSTIRFFDPVPDIAAVPCIFIMSQTQITLSDICPIRQADREIIRRKPFTHRIPVKGMVQSKNNILCFQKFCIQKHDIIFSASAVCVL